MSVKHYSGCGETSLFLQDVVIIL